MHVRQHDEMMMKSMMLRSPSFEFTLEQSSCHGDSGSSNLTLIEQTSIEGLNGHRILI